MNNNREIPKKHLDVYKTQIFTKLLQTRKIEKMPICINIAAIKGQLNSEWIYEVIVSTKMSKKMFPDFCPTLSA